MTGCGCEHDTGALRARQSRVLIVMLAILELPAALR